MCRLAGGSYCYLNLTAIVGDVVVNQLCGHTQVAEELTLDVFYDAWRRASAYDPTNGTLGAWILSQARSRAIDHLRFESREKRVNPQEKGTLQAATFQMLTTPIG